MNNFRQLNNIFGWFSFLFALVVYSLTLEPTGSLWDCGEFISAAYSLQVVHPPGAPLFLLIGRFFSLFAGDPGNVAIAVNMVSAISSAFCVMFTFWITTYFAQRIIQKKYGESNSQTNILTILAGLVAACSLTFTDTFWFSAVEAEVYASSSFFMAFTFWCIIKWERISNQALANKWLVFIGYIVGLAIGVHLLNLLVIPAIVLVYFFKKYDFTMTRLLIAIGIGFILLFAVQLVIIPGIPTLAAKFDFLFVNDFNAPFNSGVLFFLLLLVGLVAFGIVYSQMKKMVSLNTILLAFAFMLVGYSSYFMVVIRSQANTPIDMNNPENPLNLVYYLNREQYGDRPLLTGPHFETKVVSVTKKEDNYIKGEEKYEVAGYDVDIKYDPTDMMFFPRIYDGNDQTHIQGYKEWTGIKEGRKPQMNNNLKFFFSYQMGYMYWRYFFWNFAGRQNDDQSLRKTYQDVFNGNWISGIKFMDKMRLGPQSNMPDSIKNNPSRNTYFFLPFILGILGLVLQIKGDKNGSLINGILFLVTGLILIIYLNPPPYEPRERDYVFVGSFQVFCTWIGLGVIGLYDLLQSRVNKQIALGIAAAIGVIGGPTILGAENWDDHDRSGRYMSTDFARNYLKSCQPDAVLFTNGDNDTYPLWFVQNVEGYRTDVRVVNLSLLNASDYVESLRRTHYNSGPFKLTFTEKQLWPGTRDRVMYNPGSASANPNQYYNLQEVMKFIANDSDPRAKLNRGSGPEAYLPTKKFFIPVDKQKAISSGIVDAKYSNQIVDQIRFELPMEGLSRSSLVMLDVIANNFYERPVYFTTTTGTETYAGLQEYFQVDGLTYHLVPIKTVLSQEAQRMREYGFIDADKMYAQLVDSFTWGGMEDGPMWVDDKMRLVPRVMRGIYLRTARQLIYANEKEKAISLLKVCEERIPNENMPYDGSMIEMGEAYYMAGDKEAASKVLNIILEESIEMMKYLKQFKTTKYPAAGEKEAYYNYIVQEIPKMATKYGDADLAAKAKAQISSIAGGQ